MEENRLVHPKNQPKCGGNGIIKKNKIKLKF
jgi:hypothetical protein